MDIRNCKLCGNLFEYEGQPICPACNKKTEDKFADVKQYIYDNPACTLAKVAEANEIPVQMIKKWVREERLQLSENSELKIHCEKCGAQILTGRFCKDCKKQMTNSLTEIFKDKSAPKKVDNSGADKNKMHFI